MMREDRAPSSFLNAFSQIPPLAQLAQNLPIDFFFLR